MLEEVGAVECGLAAMELSPDLEIVVLVTKEIKVFIIITGFLRQTLKK